MQEVLLRVLRNAGSLRDGARFDAWLAAMVRNAVADQLRARQRHPVPASDTRDEVEAAPPASDESDETARRQLAAVLRPFAERLPALYRDVIILSELEGVPHAEIARRLAISVSGREVAGPAWPRTAPEDADRLLPDRPGRPARRRRVRAEDRRRRRRLLLAD